MRQAFLHGSFGKLRTVVGQIFYKKNGGIGRVVAEDLIAVEAKEFDEALIYNPAFTGGLTPQEYIDSIWSADVG